MKMFADYLSGIKDAFHLNIWFMDSETPARGVTLVEVSVDGLIVETVNCIVFVPAHNVAFVEVLES